MLLALLSACSSYETQDDCAYTSASAGPFTASDAVDTFAGTWTGAISWACDAIDCSELPSTDGMNVSLSEAASTEDNWLVASGGATCRSSVDVSWQADISDDEGLYSATAVPLTVRVWGDTAPLHAEGEVAVATTEEWPGSLPASVTLLLWLDATSPPNSALVDATAHEVMVGSVDFALE